MHHPGIVFHRVKVYSLTADGGWDDTGTGLVSLEPLEVRQARHTRAICDGALAHGGPQGAAAAERRPSVCVRRARDKREHTTLTHFPSLKSETPETRKQAHLEDDDTPPPLGLVVLGEENHRTLLVHRVSHEDIYHRQGKRESAAVRT
jgi:hypothetical protein